MGKFLMQFCILTHFIKVEGERRNVKPPTVKVYTYSRIEFAILNI